MSKDADKNTNDGKSTFVPSHPHGHEDRTGIGFAPKAFEHTASHGHITSENAYDMKTAVSTSTPTHSWSIGDPKDSKGRNYEVNVQGEPYTIRTSDVTGSEKISTAFPGTSQRNADKK